MTRVKEVIAVLATTLVLSGGVWATLPRDGHSSGIGLIMLAFLGLFALVIVTEAYPACIIAVRAKTCLDEEAQTDRLDIDEGDILLCTQQDQ